MTTGSSRTRGGRSNSSPAVTSGGPRPPGGSTPPSRPGTPYRGAAKVSPIPAISGHELRFLLVIRLPGAGGKSEFYQLTRPARRPSWSKFRHQLERQRWIEGLGDARAGPSTRLVRSAPAPPSAEPCLRTPTPCSRAWSSTCPAPTAAAASALRRSSHSRRDRLSRSPRGRSRPASQAHQRRPDPGHPALPAQTLHTSSPGRTVRRGPQQGHRGHPRNPAASGRPRTRHHTRDRPVPRTGRRDRFPCSRGRRIGDPDQTSVLITCEPLLLPPAPAATAIRGQGLAWCAVSWYA